jgi:hypothetical protein
VLSSRRERAHPSEIYLDARQAIAKFLVDALDPQIRRLVGVAIGRNHQEAIRIIRSRRALPSLMSGRFKPPLIRPIDSFGSD